MIKGGARIKRIVRLSIHTFTHFAVDFCCFYILFAVFRPAGLGVQAVTAGFLAYNAAAFGLQIFVGAACDAIPGMPAARVGCALTLAALLLGALLRGAAAGYTAMLLCALGNACYHVGGGADTLIAAKGRMADAGVFVASGSLGVLFGTMAGQAGAGWLLPAALMAVCVLLQLYAIPLHGEAAQFGAVSGKRRFAAALALLLAAIIVRAYGGFSISTPWKTGGFFICLPALAAFLGKAAGGFLADRFGARAVSCASLAAAAVLLTFCTNSPLLCAAGILLFNIPMPVTLCACCDLLPQQPGLSFGLTTLALFLGALPAFFYRLPAAAAVPAIGLSTAAAFVCLLFSTESRRA